MSGHRSVVFGGFLLITWVFFPACTSEFDTGEPDGGIVTEWGTIWPDTGGGGLCLPNQDLDQDKIPDTVEGCNKDTDGDQMPDYNDADSDNDQIPDRVEAGSNPSSPPDSDGDKKPDFQDEDSDNDGVVDGDEDLNGDGLLGCCLVTCGEKRTGCPVVQPNECGKGQKCQGGKCAPLVDFLCSNGETDPKKKVTFTSGGKPDKDLPTFICHKKKEQGGGGLKEMIFKSDSSGQWKVALEPTSTYGAISITGANGKEAGASFDLKGAKQQVAGFIVSLMAPAGDVSAVVTNVINKVNGMQGKSSVTLLSSGTPKTSHDGFSTMVSSQVNIKMGSNQQPAAVRNTLFTTLLGKKVANVPALWGPPPVRDFHLRFQTLLRKDGRVLIMGGVATTQMVGDANQTTEMNIEDLSNGTGLAALTNSATVECDPFILTGTPVADIIWVVDESGSMNDNRADVANNAKDFFSRALKSGLNFRIAVTNVCRPTGSYGYAVGKFCSVASTSSSHNGGPDRFLQPSEQSIFEACIKNPPGYEGGSEYGMVNAEKAVTKHLPRTAQNPAKIRPGATLVLIVATDEYPNSLSSAIGYSHYKTCTLPSSSQASVNAATKKYRDLFGGVSAQYGTNAKAVMHLIGGVCNNTCNAQIGHGYNEVVAATKGIKADVCQKNLGTSMQIIINSIVGLSSPAKLQYVPISASLAVAIDKTELARSRIKGFDYVGGSNTLVFVGVPFPKGSQVVASYRRWVAQNPIK